MPQWYSRRWRGLSLWEKWGLIRTTKAAVTRELAATSADARPTCCPRRGFTPPLIRKGHNADGSQRWLCKGCGRTFSAKSRGLLAASKLDAATWGAFVESTLAGGSLRECAGDCRVCLRTSWFMHMRFCEVMARSLLLFRTGPSMSWQVDGTYLDESLEGNGTRGATGMPRWAAQAQRRRPRQEDSNLKVCVACGANDAGDEFCRLADRGRPTDEALMGWSGTSGPAPGSPPTRTAATSAVTSPSGSPSARRSGRTCRETASSAW